MLVKTMTQALSVHGSLVALLRQNATSDQGTWWIAAQLLAAFMLLCSSLNFICQHTCPLCGSRAAVSVGCIGASPHTQTQQ